MQGIDEGIRVLAAAAPEERRGAILDIGTAITNAFNEVVRGQAELAESLRNLRETVDPTVYYQVRLLAAGLELDLLRAYARLDDVELKAIVSSDERAALRAGLEAAAEERRVLTARVAAIEARVDACCDDNGPRARAVGEG